ncbi:MAG: hypothetical protein FD123_115 [Bacteroidetes bacterium]|nr:MAG: hypothetical protein FD123_115 [Bacteroidota bacterium]
MNKTNPVRISFADEKTKKPVSVSFVSSGQKSFSFPETGDAKLTTRIAKLHTSCMPIEEKLMQWMRASEKNALAFLTDPIKALESANIGASAEMLRELKEVSNLIVKNYKK